MRSDEGKWFYPDTDVRRCGFLTESTRKGMACFLSFFLLFILRSIFSFRKERNYIPGLHVPVDASLHVCALHLTTLGLKRMCLHVFLFSVISLQALIPMLTLLQVFRLHGTFMQTALRQTYFYTPSTQCVWLVFPQASLSSQPCNTFMSHLPGRMSLLPPRGSSDIH